MKALIKVAAILILVFIVLLFVTPLLFEGKIKRLVKEEINNNVNAKVDFKDIDLSLIRNFPNFSVGIEELTVSGKNEFESDTLAYIDRISVTIGLFSVIKGENYTIKSVSIKSPKINIKVLENGFANYDISLPENTSESENSKTGQQAFNIEIKKVNVIDGEVNYIDKSQDISIEITGLDILLSGNFSGDATMISTNLAAKELNVVSDGVKYMNNVQLRYKANIDADLKNEIYTLGRNELALNNLIIVFSGSVSLVELGTNLVLTFKAPDNNFKSVLSLIPAIYAKDYDDINAEGDFNINGSINGVYNDENLPSFNIDLTVGDGIFQYPDLPKAVSNINLQANITNPGGIADQTIIDVPVFNLTLGNNPLKSSLKIKTPVSDPDINAKINGELDMASVKEYYPLEKGNELSGIFVADITLSGKLSSIEKEQYDKFIALGSVLVKEFEYQTPSLSDIVNIPHAQLNFSPQYLDLVSMKLNIGESDLTAKGKIEDYLAYAFGDGTLKGSLTTTSTYFNIDKLASKDNDSEGAKEFSEDTQTNNSDESSIVEVPDNINFTMSSRFEKLVYDNLTLEQVQGNLIIKNQSLKIQNLQSEIIGGSMTVNGVYSTKDPQKPHFDLDFKLLDINIPTSYENFALIRKYLPLAKKTDGNFSASLKLKSKLDNKMNPIFETMNGFGTLSTTKIKVKELNTLVAIANALYFDALKNMELDKIILDYQFVNGKLITKPFDLKYKNISGKLEGWTSLDQSIEYIMAMNIPRQELGGEANKLMDEIVKEAEKLGLDYQLPDNIKVGISIGGTLTKPSIKTDLKQSGNDLVKQAKEEMEKQIRKELQDQADKLLAEADKQAKAIMDEANKQSEYLRKNADDAVNKLNSETDKQVESLMIEAKKQGVLAELAAKEAVKQIRKETDKQIQTLRGDADKQIDNLLKTAKNQSDAIKQEAQKQAENILKQ